MKKMDMNEREGQATFISSTLSEATNTSLEILSFLGSLLMLSGLFVYIIRFWSEMSSVNHILITFGVGTSSYTMAVLFLKNGRLKKVAALILLVGAFFQCFGSFVVLNEFNLIGYDYLLPTILITSCLCLQQVIVFQYTQSGVLPFLGLAFGFIFLSYLFEILDLPDKYNLIVIGISFFFIVNATPVKSYPKNRLFWDFSTALFVLQGFFELLKGTPFEIALTALSCGVVYLSLLYRSKGLLAAGSVYLFWYLVYYAVKQYYSSENLAFILIGLGMILMAISIFALQINKKFLRN